MLYLHESKYIDDQSGEETKSILHRDLKPDNMLLTRTFGVKLTDFGLSRALDSEQSMTMVGTPLYTAPEIVSGEKYDEKIDVYSFGRSCWLVRSRMNRVARTTLGKVFRHETHPHVLLHQIYACSLSYGLTMRSSMCFKTSIKDNMETLMPLGV